MKTTIKALALGALLCACACNFFGDKAKSAAPFGVVLKGDVVQRITLSGAVIGARRAVISAPYDGFIKKLYVGVGTHVKAGQALVTVATSLSSDDPVFPIRAAFSGVVTQVPVLEGDEVNAATRDKFIMRVDDVSRLYIRSKVAELDITRMRLSQPAVIRITALGDKSFGGVVREIALAAEEGKENYFGGGQVEFATLTEIKDATADLRPGLSAIVDIIVDEKKNVLTLPLEYVQIKDGKYTVTTAKGETKNVSVGLRNEQVFEITGGLSEGEQVQMVELK